MTTRHASCSCGQLSLTCEGEPVRISMCHCLACQRRTGSTYGAQARFPTHKVTITGLSTRYVRIAESGNEIIFCFCPACGATLHYAMPSEPELIAVPLGAFADPSFPPPTLSFYEVSRHAWVSTPEGAEHFD
jgi:hypothetical protein